MSRNDPRTPRRLSVQSLEPRTFGKGWISGVLSVALGLVGLAAVLCFHFPSWLTTSQLRGLYPIPYVRALLHVLLVASFLLGTASVCLRYNKLLGLTGIALTLVATLLGGSRVPLDGAVSEGPFLGLDWFVLNLIVYSAVFIPLERVFAKRPDQSIFRFGWRTDLAYFFFNSLLVQCTSFLTVKPAMVLFDWAREPNLSAWISSWPLVAQVFCVLLVADLTQYWIHRAFHRLPALWRFHAVHHSVETMDWLAGSRLHIVDAIVTRAATYVPVYVLGFSESAIVAYIGIVVVQATFIHANVRWEFRPIRWLLATPCFHHWHHSAEREATDKNFAVHLPCWDWLFGTYYLPDRWPKSYGLSPGSDVPPGFGRQLVFPFRRRVVASGTTPASSPSPSS